MEFRLLGPVEIYDSAGALVPVRGRMDRALLALLLLHANQQVSVSHVHATLWDGEPPSEQTFWKYIRDLRSVLRRTFGEAAEIPVLRGACRVDLEIRHVDYHRFHTGLTTARTADSPQEAATAARSALTEWRGTALQNLNEDTAWVREQRQWLDERRGEAWRLLLANELALGRNDQVLSDIGEPLALWPDSDTLVGYRMQALYRSGRQSDALRAFQEFRADLADRQGVDPGPDLQDLHQRIISGQESLAAPPPEQITTLPTMVHTLPSRPMLVGRGDELGGLVALLDPAAEGNSRTAIVGLPGVGKTTLAVAAAHEASDAGWFDGGVVFLDLRGYDPAPVSEEEALASVLRDLGVPDDRIPPAITERVALYRSLLAERDRRGERLLVLADNASQSGQLRSILPGKGKHQLLITSRHTIADLDGVRLVDLTILTPEAAVALLSEHVRGARPHDERVATDPQAALEVARLCGHLPLALRICAALLADDPDQPVGELVEALADQQQRLSTLGYDERTVYSAFELSYRRLPDPHARMFRLLALHPGPQVSTEAAAALAELPVDRARRILQELRRAHLVEAGPHRGWWRSHDLITLFAADRVRQEEDDATRQQAVRRLLFHYLDSARAADRLLGPSGPGTSGRFGSRKAALNWLDVEREGLPEVFTVAVREGLDRYVCDFAKRLHRYFELRKHPANWIWVHRTALDCARRAGDEREESSALDHLGQALCYARKFTEATEHFERALLLDREHGDGNAEANVLYNLGRINRERRQPAAAIEHYREALRLFRDCADRRGEALSLNGLGVVSQEQRRLTDALTHFEQALAIYREIGDRQEEAMTLNNLGSVLRDQRRPAEAIVFFRQALPIMHELGDHRGEAVALNNLGSAHQEAGQLDEAADCYSRAVPLHRACHDRWGEAITFNNLGLVQQERNLTDEAIGWYRQALAIHREINDRREQAITLTNLGVAYRTQDRLAEAVEHHQQALALYREVGDSRQQAVCLTNLGVAYSESGRPAEATHCYELALPIYQATQDEWGWRTTMDHLNGTRG
ncbi:hypothetical protein D5S17_01985 [Pseudonocardiaceae bacterium YIM PH 21723]|nr:hypothetical protein D5S17_01985 [Pseudonocardiaceae bacterium YIM PH 21723]